MRRPCARGLTFLLIVSVFAGARVSEARCSDGVSPISTGFGATGPHAVTQFEVENPAWGRKPAIVHHPKDPNSAPWPVVFFAHGFGATSPLHYQQWVDHLVSRGFAVVYAPYPAVATAHERRYQVLWNGFEAGLHALGARADSTRVGFIGHSYGGGATPSLAHRALVERGWGSVGAFLVVLAPWYVLGIEPQLLRELPGHTRLLVQVYDRERINDHQIAIDLYDAMKVPSSQKVFVTLHSDESGGCKLRAGHTTPATGGIRGHVDALDHHGVFRLVDAVAADSLRGDERARDLAFDPENPLHAEMGLWPDGSPVRPLTSTRAPIAERPPNSFRFRASKKEFWIRADELEF